ncbi:MAG TPA: AAA family ATPase [Pirellulales bacterium]|nr:AAA family ATPase [Pirellulales bacterium]
MSGVFGTTDDPRLEAFCSPAGREVFHSVCHAKEICTSDPFDVRSIHAEAREVFELMIERATTPPGTPSGRSLLLVGESGSGKTHLMRAFRNYVHSRDLGYCGYLQMTTPTHNYGRYILSKLLASLDERYDDGRVQLSGLICLSTAMVERLGPDYATIIDELRTAHFGSDELAECVYHLAKDILAEINATRDGLVDPIRALVYLQRHDPALRAAAHSYLRCEDLSRFDREALGGIVPRTDDSHPLEMIESLGYLMWAVQGRPLVLFVDQLEEMYNLENAKELFRRAMGALNSVVENVPSAAVVIACLEDYYEQLKGSLAQSLVDRIERDPDKIRLESRRTEQEIIDLVTCRLAVLYEDAGVDIDRNDPSFPIPVEALRGRRNTRTRDVLDWCRRFQQEYRLKRSPPPDGESQPPDDIAEPSQPPAGATDLEAKWQTFLAENKWAVPSDESELASILATAVVRCNDETPHNGDAFETTPTGRLIDLKTGVGARVVETLVGICNKRPQGGGLARQVREIEELAGEKKKFLVRSMEFPSNPGAQISALLGDYIARGGRRTVIEDSQWRTMLAFEDFRRRYESHPAFSAWLSSEKPLTRIQSLRELLCLDELVGPDSPATNATLSRSARSTVPEGPAPSKPFEFPRSTAFGALHVGVSSGLSAAPVEMEADELCRHAAFLGGTGSGKTTVALNLIEQLIERRAPVVLVDRKGDLCRYADPDWRNTPCSDSQTTARKRSFCDVLTVDLFTPGNARGRPLRLPLVPAGMKADGQFDQLAASTGSALASIVGFGPESRYGPQRAILIHAVKQLATLRPDQESGIEELIELVDSADPSLVNAIGKLDTKHFRKIVQNLETLRLTRGELFATTAERLDFDRLLRSNSNGKTRLTLVSTKFLGDTTDVQFWIAQFLNELRRWIGGHPSAALQAALLLDEADIYLPARSQPASKAPLEDLLKRARSAGLGLLLATQSPGDLDYKCRENIRAWFLGRIKEDTALGKLKPMLQTNRVDVIDRLPGQQCGEFQLVRDGEVVSLKAARSLMNTEQLAEEAILRLARGTAT